MYSLASGGWLFESCMITEVKCWFKSRVAWFESFCWNSLFDVSYMVWFECYIKSLTCWFESCYFLAKKKKIPKQIIYFNKKIPSIFFFCCKMLEIWVGPQYDPSIEQQKWGWGLIQIHLKDQEIWCFIWGLTHRRFFNLRLFRRL